MTEGQIQKQAIDLLNLSGFIVFRLNSGKARNNIRLCPVGTPDLLAVRNGRVIWIEMKKTGGKTSLVQDEMIRDLRRHGQEVHIVDNIDILIEIIGG